LAEIRNPNQQGGGQDSRSMFLIMAVFILVFLGLQFFKSKKGPEPAPTQNQAQQNSAATPPAAPASTTPPAATPVGSTAAANVVQASQESETVVENELYRIRFSNRGGQVTSWILKKYRDEDGKPLDLVNQAAAPKFGYPLSLYTYDAGLRTKLATALYQPSATGSINAPGQLGFEYSDGSVTVHKTFTFDSSYVIRAKVSVTSNGAPVPAMLAWPSGFGDQRTLPQYATSTAFETMQEGKLHEVAYKKVVGGETIRGPFDWGGVSDLYFAAIFLPDVPAQAQAVSLHNEIHIPKDAKHPDPNQTTAASVLGAAVGDAGGQTSLRIFAGPKALNVLQAIHGTAANGTETGPNLEPVVSFGFWGFISKPFFLGLRWVHNHLIPNWGWAILIITVIINLAMLPTRIQMMRSSLKMQRIQPQIEAIKEKYKKYKATDPRRQDMNKEMFDLQKKEGVNMFGGCLPLLIQYPLLIGFYSMLSKVIELRQAHWLWLPDLSSPDPYHILPIFFIVSMFLVQYLTPSPGVDPTQQRMMAFTMPAVFGFMTWSVASGLALYWACGNIIGIIQQVVMNRTKMGREMREIAARRAAKRAGKVIAARR
jgi:YidC/Oxa1 family membrane protein insertase